MSETESHTVDRTELRKHIRATVQQADSAPPREDVVGIVSSSQHFPEQAVEDEIDQLEKHGFVYLVGDDERVKLP